MDKIKKFSELHIGDKMGKLCEKGYIIIGKDAEYVLPEYCNEWKKSNIMNFSFYIHPRQELFYFKNNGEAFFLIGHTYNPYTYSFKEEEILNQWVNAAKIGENEELDYINSVTGLYLMGKITENTISVFLDCSGMMSGYYGILKRTVMISSHTALFREVFDLQQSEYVKELLSDRFYHLYGGFLPGDISPYDNVYRIVPNTIVNIDTVNYKTDIKRFYPNRPINRIVSEEEYQKQIEKIADVFKKSMELISLKWKKPALSLTGGMDSKTTLSAANGMYDKFHCYSYISSEAEKIDANAANKICKAINVNHRIYQIETQTNNQNEYQIVREILQYNNDYIDENNANDVCKRMFFDETQDFDIEVKSWVSEIARANYYKKFGKKKMPKDISPRRCSSMYKIFLTNRSLLKKTDNVFRQYIEKTCLKQHLYNLDWSDIFLWEIRYGSWGGLVITSEHKYSYDITIPYNNRKLLELMLSVDLVKRRKDILHNDLIKKMNIGIYDTGITIVNLNETKFREVCEKIYFNINTHLPF